MIQLLDIESRPIDACKNANCTQKLVLDICGAIDAAESTIIGSVGIITDDISTEIAKSVLVSPQTTPPPRMELTHPSDRGRTFRTRWMRTAKLAVTSVGIFLSTARSI